MPWLIIEKLKNVPAWQTWVAEPVKYASSKPYTRKSSNPENFRFVPALLYTAEIGVSASDVADANNDAGNDDDNDDADAEAEPKS